MNRIERIRDIATFAYVHTEFYRKLYDSKGVDVQSINSIEDLPIVTPGDLRKDPYGFKSDLTQMKVAMTSGTISNPKILFRTEEDFAHSVQNEKILLDWAGISTNDTVCIVQPFGINGYGELTAAACKELGVFYVPLGDVSDDVVIECITMFNITVLDITPSHLLRLLSHPAFDVRKSCLRLAMVAGEHIGKAFGQYIFQNFGIRIINQFGSTECDCLAGEKMDERGMFLLKEDFIFEDVEGYLVITSLYHHGTPLVRYCLGDAIELSNDCIVIKGRQESFQLYDGVKFDAEAISNIVEKYQGFQWQCLVYEVKRKLVVVLRIRMLEPNLSNVCKIQQELEGSLDFWGEQSNVELRCCLAFSIISDGSRKTPRFIDLRNTNNRMRLSLLENGCTEEFYYSLPHPLTKNRASEIVEAVQKSNFAEAKPLILYLVHLWTDKARRIAEKLIHVYLKKSREVLLSCALEMAQSDDWEVREEAAKLIGLIIKSDFEEMSEWTRAQLLSNNDKVRRALLVAIKYCGQYVRDSEMHKKLLDMLDLLLFDQSRYVLKSFDSFTIGDGFLNICPDLVDLKLREWLSLDDKKINCKIIRVFKSSGGTKHRQLASEFLQYFKDDTNPEIRRAIESTVYYLSTHK